MLLYLLPFHSFYSVTFSVLQLYRNLLKASRNLTKVDRNLGDSSKEQIITQFRVHKDEKATPTISVLIKDGENHLETLMKLYNSRIRAHENANEISLHNMDNSWKGTKNKDGSDERGRVGTMFPWQR